MMESVELYSCGLNPDVLPALFSKLAAEERPLRHLELDPELREMDPETLKQVNPEVLVTAITKLESVVIRGISLWEDQLTAVLRMVKENRSGKLKDLEFDENGVQFDF